LFALTIRNADRQSGLCHIVGIRLIVDACSQPLSLHSVYFRSSATATIVSLGVLQGRREAIAIDPAVSLEFSLDLRRGHFQQRLSCRDERVLEIVFAVGQ
jgi:hypothetical protein